MSRVYDAVFLPNEYTAFGDRLIANPPLIDTSLSDLALHGWNLAVQKRYIPTKGHTKIRYQFYDPKKSNAFLTFKLWVKGAVENKDLVKILTWQDLIPNFNKPPSFTLHPKEIVVDEYEFVRKVNEERAERLKAYRKPKKLDIDEIQERLDNVIEFPRARNLKLETFFDNDPKEAIPNR